MSSNSKSPNLGNPLVALVLGFLLTIVGLVAGFVQFACVEPIIPPQNAPNYSGAEDKNYWKILRRAYLHGEPKTLFLNEKHLNDWARGSFSETALPAKQSFLYNAWPQAPLFKVSRSQVSIVLPIKVSVLGMDREKPIPLQVSGVFVKKQPSEGPSYYAFSPKSVLLGSATLPDAHWVREFFLSLIAQVFVDTQEYRELHPIWLKMDHVNVSGDRLILSRS